MDPLTWLDKVHVAAMVLLLGSALGLTYATWRADSTGREGQSKRWPRVLGWFVLLASLAVLPFTGWWRVHLSGWPLGQAWILGSSVLYAVALCGVSGWYLCRPQRLGTKRALMVGLLGCFLAMVVLLVMRPV
ncbi:DUF2269 family protein [Pseudomonas entomophila]|uniref:DUF2269 family protein n=1 Tax=Pseudomonas entomophila TaxID=312306 RepID=UPI003EBCD808